MQVKNVVVCNDQFSGDQALYVDGKFFGAAETIYAHGIIQGVGGSSIPFTLEQMDFCSVCFLENGDWPELLEDVKEQEGVEG